MGAFPRTERVLNRKTLLFPSFSPFLKPQILSTSTRDSPYYCHDRAFRGIESFSPIIRTLPIWINGEIRLPTVSFSTMVESILVWAQDPGRVALQLKNAVDDGRIDEAWRVYEKHIHMEGFLRKSVLTTLIRGFSETFDREWLIKAYTLVEQVFEQKKHELLDKNAVIYLSYVLARAELALPASTLLRKLIEIGEFFPKNLWICIIAYISRTKSSAFLAADLVTEIGHLFRDNRVDPSKKSNRPMLLMKPDPMAFKLVLIGCLVFGTTRKAEQLLELMPRVGVKADPDLLIVMAHVFERNGRLEEIKKLRRHIDDACGLLTDLQFQQFYSCLLSCHLKLGELTPACNLVVAMLQRANKAKSSLAAAKSVLQSVQGVRKSTPLSKSIEEENVNALKSQPLTFLEFIGDGRFRMLDDESRAVLRFLSDKLQAHVDLVKLDGGILYPSEKIYAKLVKSFLESGRINDLAGFLIKINKEEPPASGQKSVVDLVLDACIALGLLEPAHDLLDELRFHRIRVSSSVYSDLLKAYCREGCMGEITSLMKDVQKAGIQLESSCYESMIQARVNQKDMVNALHLFREMESSGLLRSGQRVAEKDEVNEKESFMTRLLMEVKEDSPIECAVHDWNNVIDFFCKKRMMNDAQKALRKMRDSGHSPNAQTFHSLVNGYAAIGGRYAEVTDLWGEMKVLTESTKINFDQELLDSLLYCFVRGGFFLRANEVAEMMERGKMFIDKYKYRTLWLKYHRKLYKGKAPKIQTEAQFRRREAALTFKAWLGFS